MAVYTAIAHVSVVLLIGHVQLHRMAILRNVPIVAAVGLVVAATAVLPPEGTVAPVVLQGAIGKELLRFGVEPPVQQVKVVGGFMHPQRTPAVHQTVPPAEI